MTHGRTEKVKTKKERYEARHGGNRKYKMIIEVVVVVLAFSDSRLLQKVLQIELKKTNERKRTMSK